MIYIGIDPGKSGGIAALREDGGPIFAKKMPDTERDIWEAISGAKDSALLFTVARTALIERAHSFPKEGVSSAFKFGMNYGLCRMALTASAIPFDETTAYGWQKLLGVPKSTRFPKQTRKRDHKNALKAKAQQLFPDIKVTLANCDALLIAEVCRRTHRGRALKQRKEFFRGEGVA